VGLDAPALEDAADRVSKELATILEAGFPKMDMVFDLDRLIPCLEPIRARIQETQVRNDPPGILIRHEPVGPIIIIDGRPGREHLAETGLAEITDTDSVPVTATVDGAR